MHLYNRCRISVFQVYICTDGVEYLTLGFIIDSRCRIPVFWFIFVQSVSNIQLSGIYLLSVSNICLLGIYLYSRCRTSDFWIHICTVGVEYLDCWYQWDFACGLRQVDCGPSIHSQRARACSPHRRNLHC